MKISIYLAIVCITLGGVSCSEKKTAEHIQLENYFSKELELKLPKEEKFYILISPVSCSSCYFGYFDQIVLFLKEKNFQIVSSQNLMNDLIERYSLNKNQFIIPKNIKLYGKQAFLKTYLTIVEVNKQQIIKVALIDEKNIFELPKLFGPN